MKLYQKIYSLAFAVIFSVMLLSETQAQTPQAVPQAKKKGDKGYKKETIQEKLDRLPVGITTPKASASLPGGNDISSVDDAKKFATETLPDLGLKIKKTFKDVKKEIKGMKREFNGRDYEGIKVSKQLIRQGSGNNLTFLEFYTLKEFSQPSAYNRHLFWYDRKANRIVEGVGRDRASNDLMHGPYKKYLGDLVVEEGWYYLGSKDGRWEVYDKNYNLLNKEYYERGFFKDSEVSFYDENKAKVKEVKPKNYGKVTGEYLFFNESGTLAEHGMMDDSVKVGKWVEYYPTGNRRKKETQFGKDCYETSFESYITYEYDEKGKITFESPKVRKN